MVILETNIYENVWLLVVCIYLCFYGLVHGKEVATMPDEEEPTSKKELNNVTCEARLLKSLILRQLEY